jgi:hypothetical protein
MKRAGISVAMRAIGPILATKPLATPQASAGHSSTALPNPPATQGRLAFVSQPVFTPSSGVDAADAICATEANGLPGTFIAALSVTGAPYASRFDTTGAPWVRIDGQRLVQRAADLGVENALTSLNLLADGMPVTQFPPIDERHVWVGGSSIGTNCGDWTSQDGTINAGTIHRAAFINAGGYACDVPGRVYCLQE